MAPSKPPARKFAVRNPSLIRQKPLRTKFSSSPAPSTKSSRKNGSLHRNIPSKTGILTLLRTAENTDEATKKAIADLLFASEDYVRKVYEYALLAVIANRREKVEVGDLLKVLRNFTLIKEMERSKDDVKARG